MEKEVLGKVSYKEIFWPLITGIAKRMGRNKTYNGGKYEPNNWRTVTDEKEIEDIKDALTRHFISYQAENFQEESEQEQLEAMACNIMILYYHVLSNRNQLHGSIVSGKERGSSENPSPDQGDKPNIIQRPPINPYNGGSGDIIIKYQPTTSSHTGKTDD